MSPTGTGHALTSSLRINDRMDVENVVVHARLGHGYAPDMELRLTPPFGTTLTIYDQKLTLNFLPTPDENGQIDYVGEDLNLGGLTSMKATEFRGEDSQGVWTLEVWDTQVNKRVGTLHDWTIELYGKAESADDTYIYTNDFAASPPQTPSAPRSTTPRGATPSTPLPYPARCMWICAPGRTCTPLHGGRFGLFARVFQPFQCQNAPEKRASPSRSVLLLYSTGGRSCV